MTKPGRWTEDEIEFLRQSSGKIPHREIARTLGRSHAAVRNKAYEIGATSRERDWTDWELDELRNAYEGVKINADIGLDELASKLGRHKTNISRKARSMGLTDISRKSVHERKDRRKYKTEEELFHARSANAKRQIRENGHSRGMAGKKHSEETKKVIARASRSRAAAMSREERSDIALKGVKTRAKNPRNWSRGSWKAGWREVGGKRVYFRSRWEANYARYLQFLKGMGQIIEWEHEPETFWFDAIKRGVRSYKPDFRVIENDGGRVWHEVKGWLDSRSKTALKRFAKYYPSERLLLIKERDYLSVAQAVAPLIDGWEFDARGRP